MSENVLAGLGADNEGIKEEKDSLGGFQVFESGLYPVKLSMVFITKSKGGAMGMTVRGKTAEGQMLDQQLWVTSGDKKGNKNYYIAKKTGDKHFLPGFNVGNAICLLTVAKNLSDLETEPGIAEIYGEKKKVDMIPALAGQEVTFGLIKQLVDKTELDDESGDYMPTGESRAENEIDKVFRTKDGLTTVEIRGGLKSGEGKFMQQWLDKWGGEVKDRTTDVGEVATAGAPKADRPSGDSAPTELFKN
jgi:hypothetical protein